MNNQEIKCVVCGETIPYNRKINNLPAQDIWYDEKTDKEHKKPMCFFCLSEIEEERDFPNGYPEDDQDLDYKAELEEVYRATILDREDREQVFEEEE